MPPKKRAKVYQRTFVGCWTCRRRKIKCDATRPHCKRCAKSKLKCEGYDIKLNWSVPLVLQNNQMIPLGNDEDEDGYNNAKDENSTFQRSNIQLCKWNIYKYYEDIDDDLEILNEISTPKKGPFSMFRFKDIDESELEQHSQQNQHIPYTRPISISPPPTYQSNQIHPALHKFVKLSLHLQNLPNTTPLTFPISKPSSNKIDTIPTDLINFITIKDDTVSISHKIINLVSIFEKHIPRIFLNNYLKFNSFIGNLVKSSLGNYLINQNDSDLLLILNVSIISFLLQLKPNTKKFNEILEFHKLSSSLYEKITPMHNDVWILNLILMIIINSTIGIHNPQLFKYDPQQETTSNTLISHYQFLKSSNILINHSQFKLTPKYIKIYEDLHQDYNLLKNFSNKFKPQQSNNGYGTIKINSKETPLDQIIKIPRYDDDGHDLNLDDDDEKPPPTIIINFQQNRGMDDEESDEIQDLEQDQDEGLYGKPLFDMNPIPNDEYKTFGISNHLIYLFNELIKLINHKRMFDKSGRRSRNFPRVCADYEDVLIKASNSLPPPTNNNDIKKHIDTTFHHCLIIMFYKLVENYPSNMLSLHFNELNTYIQQNSQPLAIFWFIKFSLDKKPLDGFNKVLNDDDFYLNNWAGKQLILELGNYGYGNDWDGFIKKKSINEFFVL